MKSLWLGIATGLTVVVGAIFAWQYREQIKDSFGNTTETAKGMARSTWGRVANAATRLTHTERDAQPS